MAATRLARQARGPGRRVSRGVRGGVGNRRARSGRNAKAPARNGAQRGMGLEPTAPSANRRGVARGAAQAGRRGVQNNQAALRGSAQAPQDPNLMAQAPQEAAPAPRAKKIIPDKTRKALGG